jgi:hypothetical protein
MISAFLHCGLRRRPSAPASGAAGHDPEFSRPDSHLPSYNSCGAGFVESGACALDFGEEFDALGLPFVGRMARG